MLCDFETLAFTEGIYRHRCRCCGVRRISRTGRLSRVCGGENRTHRTHGTNSLLDRRLAICRACVQRPPGCWKAVEYGCQKAYQEAARKAAETGSCPLHKLDP